MSWLDQHIQPFAKNRPASQIFPCRELVDLIRRPLFGFLRILTRLKLLRDASTATDGSRTAEVTLTAITLAAWLECVMTPGRVSLVAPQSSVLSFTLIIFRATSNF